MQMRSTWIRRRSHLGLFFFRWCFQTSTGPALSNVHCKTLTGTCHKLSLVVAGATFHRNLSHMLPKLYHSHPEAAEITADSMLKLSGIPHFSWKCSMTNSPPNTHLKQKQKKKPTTKNSKKKKEKKKSAVPPFQCNETLSASLTTIRFPIGLSLQQILKAVLVPHLPAVRREITLLLCSSSVKQP